MTGLKKTLTFRQMDKTFVYMTASDYLYDDYCVGKLVKFRHTTRVCSAMPPRSDVISKNWVIRDPRHDVIVFIGSVGMIIDKPLEMAPSQSFIVLVEEHVVVAAWFELELFSNRALHHEIGDWAEKDTNIPENG